MNLFHIMLKKEDKPGSTTRVMSAQVDYQMSPRFTEVMEGEIARQVMDQLADKITDAIYEEIILDIKKNLIVKEVSLKVSDKIIENLFRTDNRGDS